MEPVAENVRTLEINKALNDLDLQVCTAAVDAAPGEVVLYPNEWWSSSTVSADVAGVREGNAGRMEHSTRWRSNPSGSGPPRSPSSWTSTGLNVLMF